MHHKFAKDGLVVVSVNLDEVEEDQQPAERLNRVKKILVKKKAVMTNLILDEKPEFWNEKFGLKAYPFIYVFNRQGKWQRFGDEGEVNYQEVDKLVMEFLKEKP